VRTDFDAIIAADDDAARRVHPEREHGRPDRAQTMIDALGV
jgi:hypothetical protein